MFQFARVLCRSLVLTFASSAVISPFSEAASGPGPNAELLSASASTFTRNEGQWPDSILYRAAGNGAVLWFTADGVYHQISREVRRSAMSAIDLPSGDSTQTESLLIRTTFVEADPRAILTAEGVTDYKCNYFFGDDESQWHTDVANFHSISYNNLYDGVDLRFRYQDGALRAEFAIQAGADPSRIKLRFEGIEGLAVGLDGKLTLETLWGSATEMLPAVNGSDRSLAGDARYRLIDAQTVGFEIDAPAGSRQSLLLAPALTFSTYLGGGSDDEIGGITVNGLDQALVCGLTNSANFPFLTGLDNSYNNGGDVFVTQFNASGNGLIFSTYIGGSATEYGLSIATSGTTYAILVVGFTQSSNFPTANATDNALSGTQDAFLLALSSTGNTLTFSTFLGGGANEAANDLAVVCPNNCLNPAITVWVVGQTFSTDFPVLDFYDNSLGGTSDAFITQYSLTSIARTVEYSTYYGGSNQESAQALVTTGTSPFKAYVAGYTQSGDLSIVNGVFPTFDGSVNGFVAVIETAGSGSAFASYSSYVPDPDGVNDVVYLRDIALGSGGDVYVCGSIAECIGSGCDPDNVFIQKHPTSAGILVSSTLVGSDYDTAHRLRRGLDGNVYLVGTTQSADFPTLNPYDGSLEGSSDALGAIFEPTGLALLWSSYLGGNSVEVLACLALDNENCMYIAGKTGSTNFPVINPYSGGNAGAGDGFLTKVCLPLYVCGDADGSGIVSISDAVYLISYIFAGGPAPSPLAAGDADCSGTVNISDAVFLINYIFAGGPVPCSACP